MTIDLGQYVDGCLWGEHAPWSPQRYLYALLDVDGNVLYIGRTKALGQRLNQHRRKPWWSEVADFVAQRVCCTDAQTPAEVRAIRDIRPPYNADPDETTRKVIASRRAKAEPGRRAREEARARRAVLETQAASAS